MRDVAGPDAITQGVKGQGLPDHLKGETGRLGCLDEAQPTYIVSALATNSTLATDARWALRQKICGIHPLTKIDVSSGDRCEGDEHAVSPANDSAVCEHRGPDDPPMLLPSYTRPAAFRQKISALASRTHVQAVMHSIRLFLEMELSEASTLGS